MYKIGAAASNVVATAATIAQIDYAGIENVFSIICIILTTCSIALSLVLRLIDAVKKAKADGKVTADEIKEIVQIGKEGIDEIVENIDNSNLDKREK